MSLVEGAREESPGVSRGFNLDGLVSDGSDPEGCFQPDYRGPPPDRTAGIDNQVVILAPLVETAVGEDLDRVSRRAIGAGRIEPFVEALRASVAGLPRDLVRSTLEGVADLDPDRVGRCDSVSMAFRLEAVRATRAD
jgi:hypothetical protein